MNTFQFNKLHTHAHLQHTKICAYIHTYIHTYIQGVTGGMCETSGERSLC